MEHPTFAERIKTLKGMATQLRAFAEIILSEAQRMESAQVRFQQRVTTRVKPRQR